MRIKTMLSSLLISFLYPQLAWGQFETTNRYILTLGNLINLLVPIVLAIAVLIFFWGLVKFITKAGDTKELEKGRTLMIWGIITLFVMVSVWGLVGFIRDEVGIRSEQAPSAPVIPKP